MPSKRVTDTPIHWHQFRANRGNRYSPHQYWPTAVHVYMVINGYLLMLISYLHPWLTLLEWTQEAKGIRPDANENHYHLGVTPWKLPEQ